MQLASSVVLNVPGRQSDMGKQNVEPVKLVQPSQHDVQLMAPVVFEKVPTWHCEQDEEFASE